MNELLALVDSLAAALSRPVGLDDPGFRSIAYSSHSSEVDRVRLASILQREAPEDVIAWLERLDLHALEEPTRLPSNAALGMAARVCVPVRFDATTLGFLWLIDEPVPLTDQQMSIVDAAVEDLAVALFRKFRVERAGCNHEHELVRVLIVGDVEASRRASVQLVEDGILASASHYVALVAQAFHADGGLAPDLVRVRVAAATERLRRTVGPHRVVVLVHADHVVALHAVDRPGEERRHAQAVVDDALTHLSDVDGWRPVVGVGAVRGSIDGLRDSYEEARISVCLGRKMRSLGPLLSWDELGAYSTIAALAGARESLPPPTVSVRRLLEAPDAGQLVPTLETWLDRAGDARATAEELFLHRSSLYGRLRRIERTTGADLGSGEDRLELHLGLRLWRMSGGNI